MAEIKKIKVDGIEYDIGSNLGAELEWKLVASGFYDDTQSNDNMIEYLLDKKLEENKLYYIERYDGNYGSMYHCFFKQDYDCYIRATDRENEESCEVYLAGYEIDRGYRIQLAPDTPIYYGEDDDIKVYELAIKNVENPSNVVTPNKLKLYTTGTYYNEGSAYPQATYLLDKNLEPNKMYYIERYDYNMESLFSCFMTTYYDEDTEEVETKGICMMKAYENDEDTLVDTIIKLGGGTSGKRHLIIRTLDDRNIYVSEEDTLKVYELPFEF